MEGAEAEGAGPSCMMSRTSRDVMAGGGGRDEDGVRQRRRLVERGRRRGRRGERERGPRRCEAVARVTVGVLRSAVGSLVE